MSKAHATFGIVFLYIFAICCSSDSRFVRSQDPISTKKPKIIMKLKNMKVLRDQQAIFICASIGNPVPSMRWLVNDNHDLPKRYTVENSSPQNSVLRLDPVSVNDDRSRITCQATSVMGTSYSFASLTVYKNKEEIPKGFPTLISKSAVIVNEKNTRVALECKVEGNPKPNIVWLKDSIPIDTENLRIKFLNNGGLEINKTLEDDEGGYECIADNKHGTIVSPMIRLMIRVSYFAPHFVSVPNDQIVLPGSSLTLKCRALGNPIPLVYWKCGQTILQPHTSNSTLQKAEANVILSDLSESLKCTCIAKNSKESISQSISVTIQEPSVAPPNIKVSHVTATSCMVSWNQKAVRDDQQKYQLFVIKTSDLHIGKNTRASSLVNVEKRDSEMNANTKIDNLLPFTNYTIWFESFPIQSDSIKSNLVSFMTLELPPSSSPKNVELSAISNGALIVMWDPPDIPNGIITSYAIYYTQYRQIPLSRWDKYDVKSTPNYDSKQQIILSHLLNNVTYYISISSQNGAGSGPVSEPQAILVRAGVVQGPKNFRAVAKSPTEIQLFWDPLISKTQINVLFYHLIYMPKPMISEKVQRKWKYTSIQNTISVSNLKPNTTYEFQLSADTASASGMVSTVECTTSVKVCPVIIKNWKLVASLKKGIKVCWPKTKEIHQLKQIKLIFQSKFKTISIKLVPEIDDKQICHHQIEDIIPNTKYDVSWFMEENLCNIDKGVSSWIVTKFSPVEEPIVVHARVLNSTSIEVSWKTTAEMRKQVEIYRIQCRRFASNAKDVKDEYLKNSSISMKAHDGIARFVFTQLYPNTLYQIHLNTITRHRSGSPFKSEPVKTWPKKLPKPEYLHLRLSCSINNPCVRMEWRPANKDLRMIKGYQVRYYPLIENGDVKFKIHERNVTQTVFETSSLDHYQGFRYEFKVAAFNEYEIGEESTDQIFILEGTPSVYPPGFKLKSISQSLPTSVSFEWDKLPQNTLNGRFDHYEVWCYIVINKNETSKLHSTNTESITINNLVENSNYACHIRVWIKKSAGLWSDPIYFKTKDAHLPPPDAIRFIRLSHSIALISWKWRPDFLLYYSYFVIYYANEKTIPNPKIWFVKPTKSAHTKFILDSLNATVSYAVRVASVSNRGIEGPLSNIVKEVYLSPESWPVKFVNQLSCAPESSSTIQLRWSVAFNNQELTHFRVNFTGVTKFQSDQNIISRMRDEQEQSALIYDKNKYYTHQIKNLKPNTRYTINIEPIFSPQSIMIGAQNQTICTTFRDVPSVIETPILYDINKTSNEIEILIQRPNLENGTIDTYYVVVKVVKQSVKIYRKRRFSEGTSIDELLAEQIDSKDGKSNVYVALSLEHDEIFHLTTPVKIVHKVLIGSGLTKGSFVNKKLQPNLYYEYKILACIRVGESQNRKLRCKSSQWSKPVNTKLSVLPNKFKPNTENSNSFKHLSKQPLTLTTTTVVVILGTVIFAVFSMSVFLFVKRRQLLKSKLGNVYGVHSNRVNNEKSMCMEHLLKEPLVDSSVRISTSGSLRFKNHTNNCIEANKIQLSSTPDLLVRSSVPQPFSSLVQFHGQHLSNKHFEYAPIPVEALAEQVALLKENDGKLFNKEYESIEPGQQFTWNNSNMEVNRLKNRYANVIAYDHSRVVLQPLIERRSSNNNETRIVNGSDYINANYISGYLNPKAYIATQGPISESIGDFWRMMWEQNSSVIVMMTRLEERDRTKCDQYWPLGGKGSIATYSYINVTIVDITELAYYTIRKFHIQKLNDSSTREVYQLQFTAWPDHGVPNHPAPLLMFLRRVHSEIPRNCGPIVVHCSAGVGRTGAFIVIDYMLERLRYENTVDIYNYVTNIRAQRNYMVQTEDQYIFIYETLLEAIQCGNTEVPVSELSNHIEKLNQIEITHKTVDGIQMTGLQMEFENLVLSSEGFLQGIKLNANNLSHCSTPSTTHGNIVTNYQPLTYDTATQMVNQMKNRIIQILPPDFSRVNICPIRGVEGSDYINASWIDGYKSRRAYIAAQSPLAETCEDFWRTLWEHNSSIIVMLTQLKENNRERCYQYWPFKRSSRYQFFIVDPVAEYNMTTYIIREFKLTDTRDSQSRVIRQFQFTQWQESESIPHSTHVFLDLINQVQKTKVQLGHDGPITVHCSAGSGRTGIFLALSNIIERMKNESVIDLFQTVKLLRWQRPALLQTEDQYQFCYMAALEYLKLFEQIQFDL